jgi:hypothetical protein
VGAVKAFSTRFFFQFSVGFLFGAGIIQSDLLGVILLTAGFFTGIYIYSK